MSFLSSTDLKFIDIQMNKAIPTIVSSDKDRYPSYCLSFSPNWNTHQIISTNEKGQMAYGVNMEVFIVDLLSKDFLTSIKPEETTNYKHYKVSSVLLDESMLYTGYAQGSVYCYNHKMNNEILFKMKLSQDPIMHILKAKISEEKIHILAIDSEGIIFDIISLEGIQKSIALKINCYGSVIKAFIQRGQLDNFPYIVLVSQKGIISLWNLLEEKELFKHDTKSYLTSADILTSSDNDELKIALITRKDQAILLNLKIKDFLNPEAKNGLESISTTKLHFQIDTKLKNDQEVQTARSHILFLDSERVLISGKAGEMYKVNMSELSSKQIINLKHLSAELEENTTFEVVERNPHYKQIYIIQQFTHRESQKNYLLALSIDRQLSIWLSDANNPVNDLLHMWDIKFLGGKISEIAISELEKNKLFLSCIDKTFRIWDLEKKNNKFSTFDVWKQVSQTPVHSLALHPSQEGIAAYSTEDSKICLFDLPNQICFKVLKVARRIKHLYWVRKDLIKNFLNFVQLKGAKKGSSETKETQPENGIKIEKEETKNDSDSKEIKIDLNVFKYSFPKQSDSKFTKSLSDEYWIIAILEESFMVIYDPNSTPEIYFVESLLEQDSFSFSEYQGGLIIATGSKKGESRFLFSKEDSIEEINTFANNIYHISCIAFNKPKEGNLLCATSSHDRKIIIYEFLKSETSKTGIFILPRITLKHKNKVDKVKWSPANYLLAIAAQDKTVQIWNCNITENDRKGGSESEKPNQREICNIRGHDGYITDAEFSLNDFNIVITASDDQTVKVWDMNRVLHKTIASKKKKNKKKKLKTSPSPNSSQPQEKAEEVLDDDESDEEAEDEAPEK